MRVALIAAFLIVAVSGPALAQVTPAVEIGLGYAYMRDDGIDENFPLGWYVDIAGNLNDWLGLVGEVGGNYKTVNDSEFEDLDIKLSVHTAMGGLRLTHRGDSANFYIQTLAGVAKQKISFVDEDLSTTDFALQPGVGIELGTGGSAGFRIGADYRRIFGDDQDGSVSEWRATAGFVFRMGQR